MRDLNSSLKQFIVRKVGVSHKAAIAYILSGQVLVNGEKGRLHQRLGPEDAVSLHNQLLKEPEKLVYLAYYKPCGVETTLNPHIENNLLDSLQVPFRVFPVGRLDKASEGLLLLTNNGQIFNKIIHAESLQQKEYVVTVDKPLTQAALDQLTEGIVIMGQKTRPALVEGLSATSFRITLTQGLNRQIRRMCYKLGYEVERLIRTRIISLHLGTLAPGEWRHLSTLEVEDLLSCLPSP